jgi:hypothetical protein
LGSNSRESNHQKSLTPQRGRFGLLKSTHFLGKLPRLDSLQVAHLCSCSSSHNHDVKNVFAELIVDVEVKKFRREVDRLCHLMRSHKKLTVTVNVASTSVCVDLSSINL